MAAVYKTLLVNQQLLELTKKLEYIVDSTIFFHGLRRHVHLEMNCDPFSSSFIFRQAKGRAAVFEFRQNCCSNMVL